MKRAPKVSLRPRPEPKPLCDPCMAGDHSQAHERPMGCLKTVRGEPYDSVCCCQEMPPRRIRSSS